MALSEVEMAPLKAGFALIDTGILLNMIWVAPIEGNVALCSRRDAFTRNQNAASHEYTAPNKDNNVINRKYRAPNRDHVSINRKQTQTNKRYVAI
ncbi:MAG: hypothetical protein QG657_3059 [Acidobacteriota bacterium]|nr:hypothetical protein [Acidobacteriota bacterium]